MCWAAPGEAGDLEGSHFFLGGESVTFWECMVGMRISTPSMQWPRGFSSYFEAKFSTIRSWEELNCIRVHSSDSFSVFFGPLVREKYLAEYLGYGMHWIHGIVFFLHCFFETIGQKSIQIPKLEFLLHAIKCTVCLFQRTYSPQHYLINKKHFWIIQTREGIFRLPYLFGRLR